MNDSNCCETCINFVNYLICYMHTRQHSFICRFGILCDIDITSQKIGLCVLPISRCCLMRWYSDRFSPPILQVIAKKATIPLFSIVVYATPHSNLPPSIHSRSQKILLTEAKTNYVVTCLFLAKQKLNVWWVYTWNYFPAILINMSNRDVCKRPVNSSNNLVQLDLIWWTRTT